MLRGKEKQEQSVFINPAGEDADAVAETEMLVERLPTQKRQEVLEYLRRLQEYVESEDYFRHMKTRGYSDAETVQRREQALRGLFDLANTSDEFRSFATVFVSTPPSELRQRELSQADVSFAKQWYQSYSSVLEATALYEAVKNRGLDANSDIVDKLLIGTAYSFGHTSRRTGVFVNYVATQSILTATLDALADVAQEKAKNGQPPNLKEVIKTHANDASFQKRLAEHVLVNSGVAEWEDPQSKQRLRTEIRTKAGSIKETSYKSGVLKRKATGDVVVAVASPKPVDDEGGVISKLRGNILWGVWSMFNSLRGADAKQAVEFGATPFSDVAKKTLNYSYQIIHSMRFSNGKQGQQLLPHDPLTVRDVWETAGTLGQIRVIKELNSPRLLLGHLNNIFVPLGFRIGFDEKADRYVVSPIDEVWRHIANNPEELQLYHSFAKEVLPSEELPPLPLFETLPQETQQQAETAKETLRRRLVSELIATTPPETPTKQEVKVDIHTAYEKSIPVFRSEEGTTIWQPFRMASASKIDPKQMATTIGNAIAKHINALYDVSQTFTLGVDAPETAGGRQRYWIGFNQSQAERVKAKYRMNLMDMAHFEGNGATVLRDERGNIREVRFYEDDVPRLFAYEKSETATPQAKQALGAFSAFVTKLITGNEKLQSGFVPAIVETYTTADEEYRSNVATLRKQMESELASAQPIPVPKTTLKQRLKTLLTAPSGEPASQTIQPQCWLAYRNAVKGMGAYKAVRLQ